MKFWSDHYSSNLMTLVVVHNQKIEDYEGSVREIFGEIENKNLIGIDFKK